jgi:hypothetical protein
MNGFSYKKDKVTFKSSAIAKNYSWQNLQKNGLKYDQTRDTEFLKGVKNEFTQKLNLESGRDRSIEMSKSVVNSAESITNRTKSTFSESIRSEIKESDNRTTGHTNLYAKSESFEVHKHSTSVAFTEKLDGTKISDEAVFENGYRKNSQRNGANPRENSETTESKDNFAAIDVRLTEPKFNPAPKREPERKESGINEIEKDYSRERSR